MDFANSDEKRVEPGWQEETIKWKLLQVTYLYFPPTRDMPKNTRNCKANEMYQNIC